MSWASVMPGIRERLESVAGLVAIYEGEPTAIHATPAAFYYFDSMPRGERGQVVANRYTVPIVVVVPWLENAHAEAELAPFINSIPAAFDSKSTDSHGRQYATLGGRIVNGIARVTSVQGTYVIVGEVKLRAAIFVLDILDKGPTGSGI